MRFLVLFAPRLGIQLLRRDHPELAGHPVALAAGDADSRLLSVISREATLQGVEPGMTPAQARERCPGIAIEEDNARDCLDTLERLTTILSTRTTKNVAIVSRCAIVLDLDGTERQFFSEDAAAQAILAFARSHSGLDLRASVASSIDEGLCAAKSARRFPAIRDRADSRPETLPKYQPVSVSLEWPVPLPAAEVQAKLVKFVAAMQPLLDAYGQSYRSITIERTVTGLPSAVTLRPNKPVQRAAEALKSLRQHVGADAFEGVTRLRVTLGTPGPSLSVQPWRAPMASLHELTAPARPIQRRLLRAS
jgi:hypothetical protein